MQIFNPHGKYCLKQINEAYKYHETLKKFKYGQRVLEVEGSSYAPLVFASTGGAGPAVCKVMKRIAEKMNEKSDASYADTIFIR